MTARNFVAFVVAAALLSGCGQRGALYLPEDNRNVVVTPASPATDATDPQRRKDPAAPAK